MKIKKDNYFDLFISYCDSLGVLVREKRLLKLLDEYCDCLDCEDNYGFTLGALYEKELKHVSIELCGNCYLYYSLKRLTLLGDGNCPVCGGDLKLIDSQPIFSKEWCDYDCEPEIEEENIYRCVICGKEVQ